MPTRNPDPDYVTGAELTRWMNEEANFRARLEQRMDAQHKDVKAELVEIKWMVKEANGKTNKNAETIAIVQRDLEAIKSEDRAIEQTVEAIRSEGCAQLANHEMVLRNLGWSREKKMAVAGGLVGTGALIWPALQELAKAFHLLLEKIP